MPISDKPQISDPTTHMYALPPTKELGILVNNEFIPSLNCQKAVNVAENALFLIKLVYKHLNKL